jgi:hypothetical protein
MPLSSPEHFRAAILVGVVVLAIGPCARPPAEKRVAGAGTPAIDSARAGSADAAAAWGWRREARADLDGDGRPETVAIASDVTAGDDGLPLWEDGHRWAVYVEAETGRRTLLYSAFVPRGHAEAAILAPDEEGRRHVLVQERTPSGLRVLQIGWPDGEVTEAKGGGEFAVAEWLPGPDSR